MADPKRVVAVVNYDNRLPVTSDVSAQLMLALNRGQYQCPAVTTTITVKATMTNPNGGKAQVIFDLLVPTGETHDVTGTAVTAALNGLNLPFSALIVNSVTVFDSAADPTPGPPVTLPGAPTPDNL